VRPRRRTQALARPRPRPGRGGPRTEGDLGRHPLQCGRAGLARRRRQHPWPGRAVAGVHRGTADLPGGCRDRAYPPGGGVALMSGFSPQVASLGVSLGLLFALGCYLVTNLSPGGMITPAWLALTLIDDWRRVFLIVIVALLSWGGIVLVGRFV